MPKIDTDYSKCIVYKIVCIDLNVTDCYVGHTTSFKHRKAQHKSHCNNEKGLKYNLKVYQIIRANGGWKNFSMIEIEKYPCKDKNEAAARERFWYEQLNSNMNSQVPNQTSANYYAENQEKIKEYKEKYYLENKEKIKETNAKYYAENQEKIKETSAKYYAENQENANQKFDCPCGGKYLHQHKAKHIKTKKHLNFITSNNKDAETVTENKEIEPI